MRSLLILLVEALALATAATAAVAPYNNATWVPSPSKGNLTAYNVYWRGDARNESRPALVYCE